MYGTYLRLVGRARLTVWAPDDDIIAAATKMLSSAGRAPSARKARLRFFRSMLRCHHNDQKLCRRFAL